MAIIDGTPNDDFLQGTPNDDTINGFDGNDILSGFPGDNLLDGGKGNDTLFGDVGRDIFVLTDDEDYGVDRIEDFVVGEDVIQLDGLSSRDAIAYNPNSGDLLSNDRIVAQLPTGLTFESDSFSFDVNQSKLTLNIPFNDFVDLSNITFTKRSDVVKEKNLILIPDRSFISTLAGNDLISSIYTTDTPPTPKISLPTDSGDSREAVLAIYNQGPFDTSSGNDVVLGNVTYTGEFLNSTGGIFNGFSDDSIFIPALISTGSGDDRVLGFAASSNSGNIIGIENFFSSEINTGVGRDEVIGKATGNATNLIIGINQDANLDVINLITTGSGDDKVIGKVINGHSDNSLIGIFQDRGNNQTITGNGNDKVIGKASGTANGLAGIDQEDGNNQIVTGNGNDEVIGTVANANASTGLIGIAQSRGNNQIVTDNGDDKVIGKASGNLELISEEIEEAVPAIAGISQQFGTGGQQISTGNGTDEIRGTATGTATSDNPSIQVPIVGIVKSNSSIETGNSNDKVIGEASGTADQIAGIVQQGSEDLIITEKGDDEIRGTASGSATTAMAGIAQQPGTAGSQIITGEGNDKIVGTASNDIKSFLVTAGILGDLDINTGSGDDEVIASARESGTRVDGFAADPLTGGTVTVDTGSGNDLVKGFGQGNFDGGKGNRDIYDLSEYHKSEFTIEIGTGGNNEVDFIFGGSTAFTQGFEVFRFADDELSFADLP